MENNANKKDQIGDSDTQIFEVKSLSEKSIFLPNITIENEVKEKCGIPNWGQMIFGLFNKNLREILIETSKKNQGYHYFILGVQHEYGIDTEINIVKALEFYNKSAEFKETFALHKLYNIHCYENEKFKVKRNREKELFYLFQSIAYSDASFFMNNDTFFKVDISMEITIICRLEDNLTEKIDNLFKNCIYLEENKDDMTFIQSIISLKFLSDNMEYEKQLESVKALKILAEQKHLESCYKLAVVFRQNDKNYSELLFRYCIEKKLAKAYLDYGIFLHSENKMFEALDILKEGIELGNFRCNFIYYDLFLTLLDMEKNYMKLIDLSQILIEDILIGNVFSLFDFFFKRKILIKHFKLPIEKLYNKNISDLLEITEKSLTEEKMIIDNFSGNIVFTELLLSHGFLNYIGAKGKTDYQLAEKCLKESFKTSQNNSYKRFCYSYICKIRLRRLGFKKQKIIGDFIQNTELSYKLDLNEENEAENKIVKFEESKLNEIKKFDVFVKNELERDFNGNIKIYDDTRKNIENSDENDEIFLKTKHNIWKSNEDIEIFYEGKFINKDTKIKKTKNKLFKIYNDSIIEGNLEDFSSSYFFFMGKINENGWGCKIDEIGAYCYFMHGKDANIKTLGTGSIISYYRRYKSGKKLESQRYIEITSKMDFLKNEIIKDSDEKECCICYTNEINVIFFPCKHLICFGCYCKIKESSRCPTCRSKILLIK